MRTTAPPSLQEWKVLQTSDDALELQTSAGHRVVLGFSPPSVACFSPNGEPILKWNADGYFAFEHTRTKQVRMEEEFVFGEIIDIACLFPIPLTINNACLLTVNLPPVAAGGRP